MPARFWVPWILGEVALLSACGGGGSQPDSTITGITVVATPPSITLAQQSSCTATVAGNGAFNDTVHWTATGGTITAAGLLKPSSVGTATCTATSAQNPAVFASARIEVSYPAPILTSIGPTDFVINSGFFGAETFGVSRKISANQGYATDGTNNFLFSTQKITETDSQWNTTYTNLAPFAGTTIKLDHVGDGEVGTGRIYVPLACATQEGCSPEGVAIGVYAADTAGLPLLQWVDITSSGCDGSGIAVGPNNTLYVSSFFVNPDFLCLFDATSLTYKGTLTLSVPIPRIQGISFDPASQRFAVTADNVDRTVGYVYFVSLTGQVVGPAYTVPQSGELEGLDFTQGYIGYVVNPFDYVYFLFPLQVTGSDFYAASLVEVDGAVQPTTYESDGLLDAVVAAGALGGFGQVRITVRNPSPGGGNSAAAPLSVTSD